MALTISLIIPAFNEEAVLARAIESAWAAGASEVLVADGGSHDRTQEIAQQSDCRLVVSAKGRAVQQNAAAQLATGDVLLFLHADNWLAPQACNQIQEAMRDERIVCGAFRQRIEASDWRFRLLERGNSLRVQVCGLPYGDQGIFIRRHIFSQIGGFPETRFMEDVLFMQRLRRIHRPVLLPGPLHVAARRWQQYGVVRQTLRNWGLLSLLALGVSPDRLAAYYPLHRG